MTLREKQSEFCRNVSRLIRWAFENGMELTFGEALRTPEQQLLYFGLHYPENRKYVTFCTHRQKNKNTE
jgi:hypothetical protein